MEDINGLDELVKNTVYLPSVSINSNDFIGFSYGGVHCSEMGIIRVSENNRYNNDLLPTSQDKTVQIPGNDGTYYFGSYYTQRTFSVSFAFDSLTERQLKDLKMWLGDRRIKDLIFDEYPYKVYKAKVTSTASIKHLCFEEDGKRVYKGEGSVNFTCFYPFGLLNSKKRFLADYFDKNPDEYISITEKEYNALSDKEKNNFFEYSYNLYFLKPQWSDSAKLLDFSMEKFYFDINNKRFLLYNPGDVPCHFTLIIKGRDKVASFVISINNSTYDRLELSEITLKQGDCGIKIDSKRNLIIGIDEDGFETSNIYNEYILNGNFFLIPLCEVDEKDENNTYLFLETDAFFNEDSGDGENLPELDYLYLYY